MNDCTDNPRLRMAGIRVAGAQHEPSAIRAYLYRNFKLMGSSYAAPNEPTVFVIVGLDDAGFTLEAQIERLASGLIFAEEVTHRQVTLLKNLVEV